MNQLPTFLIIGAMKAGTTTLHDYLSVHPDVFVSKQKELDFFVTEKNWNLGLDWYKEQFPQQALAIGESSPNYTKSLIFGGVPERIKATLPNVKLIYILRDPVKRLISHYSHQFIDRKEFRTINEVAANLENNHYVDSSLYGKQLSHYLNHFNLSDILILRLEELEKEPLSVLHKIFEFIGVDSKRFVFNEIKSHKTSEKRRLTSFGFQISRLPMGIRLCNLFSKWCWEEFSKPMLTDQNAKLLRGFFEKDLQKLKELTGKKFYW